MVLMPCVDFFWNHVQHEDHALELRGVDPAVGASVGVDDDLKHLGAAVALKGLRVGVLVADLCESERGSHDPPNILGRLLEVLAAGADPPDGLRGQHQQPIPIVV